MLKSLPYNSFKRFMLIDILIDSGLLTGLIIVRDYSAILRIEDPIKLGVVNANREE
jgi:hypothetical protein